MASSRDAWVCLSSQSLLSAPPPPTPRPGSTAPHLCVCAGAAHWARYMSGIIEVSNAHRLGRFRDGGKWEFMDSVRAGVWRFVDIMKRYHYKVSFHNCALVTVDARSRHVGASLLYETPLDVICDGRTCRHGYHAQTQWMWRHMCIHTSSLVI